MIFRFPRSESLGLGSFRLSDYAKNPIKSTNERTEMSSQDPSSDTAQPQVVSQGAEGDNDAVASKLSRELSNWRRRRSNGRPRRSEGERVNYQTDSARTIKLRGHETLVVRKPRLVKPAFNQRPNP
jgi:hypothetical protein